MSQELFNRAQNENIKYKKDMMKSQFGNPGARDEMLLTLDQYSPTELEANKYQMYGNQAWQNAIANEQAAIMDRTADWYENQISSKNNSDELAAGIQNRAADNELEAIRAAERMNRADNASLASIGESLQAPANDFMAGQNNKMSVPGITGYDSSGKKIWGTYFS